MKSILAGLRFGLAALLSALMLPGCNPLEPDSSEFLMVGTWAGESWRGEASSFQTAPDTLWISAGSPTASFPVMHLSVTIPPISGRHTLQSGDVRFFYLVGGDATTAQYGIAPGEEGVATIEELTDRQVRGSIEFDAIRQSGEGGAGPRARFEGTFSAPIR